MTLLPIGQTGSHAGPVFRDAFRAVTPRVTGFIGNTISDPLGVVDVGSAGSPQYWPEDPSSAGEPWTDANVVHMGAGDGLELVAGGADADNEIAAVIIYVLDPIIDNETGAVVAFVERRLVAFNVTLGAAQVGASDPLADLDVVSVGDHLADTIAVSGTAPDGVFTVSATPWAHAIIEARQSFFIHIGVLNASTAAFWLLGRRLQGDALSVSR